MMVWVCKEELNFSEAEADLDMRIRTREAAA
jgi:hypothetical protein